MCILVLFASVALCQSHMLGFSRLSRHSFCVSRFRFHVSVCPRVDDNLFLDETTTKQSTDGRSFEALHFESLTARLLGLRMATASYFSAKSYKDRMHKANIIKIVPCTTMGKNRDIVVAKGFDKRQYEAVQILKWACSLRASKWSIVEPEKASKSAVTLNRLADLHNLVKSCEPKIN